MSRPSSFVSKSLRLAIYDRDGFKCVYCQKSLKKDGVLLSLDHVIAENTWKKLKMPKSGLHRADNLVTACHSCNSSRKDSEILDRFGKVPYNRVNRQIQKPVEPFLNQAKLLMKSMEYSEILLKVKQV